VRESLDLKDIMSRYPGALGQPPLAFARLHERPVLVETFCRERTAISS
jgi:hypothetical protein